MQTTRNLNVHLDVKDQVSTIQSILSLMRKKLQLKMKNSSKLKKSHLVLNLSSAKDHSTMKTSTMLPTILKKSLQQCTMT